MAVNPFDPFDLGLGQLSGLPAPTALPNRSPIQPLPKPEEDALLTRLTGQALGGLGYVGGMLDKTFGGRAVRGLLGGHPRELLSVLPGSDVLGLTDEADRVSGEDLARQAGLLEGEGEKGTFEARDLVGPALEAALDPATYLSFGGAALSKAGTVAKRAGLAMPRGGAGRAVTTLGELLTTPEARQAAERAAGAMGHSLADLEKMNLGGHVGFGLPIPGTANVATADLSGVLDPLAAGLKKLPGYGKVAGVADKVNRNLAALFDPAVRGTVEPEMQAVSRQAETARRAMDAASTERMLGIVRPLQEQGLYYPGSWDAVRGSLENQFTGPLLPAQEEAVAKLKAIRDPQMPLERRLGGKGVEREDYAARQRTPLPRESGVEDAYRTAGEDPFSLFHASQKHRKEFLEGVPGGTAFGLNPMLADPNIVGPDRLLKSKDLAQEAQYIREKYLGFTPSLAEEIKNKQAFMGPPTAEDAARLEELLARQQQTGKQGLELASFAANAVDPRRLEPGAAPYFGNDPFYDMLTREKRHNRFVTNANALFDVLAKAASPNLDELGPGAVPLAKVLEGAGATPEALKEMAARLPLSPVEAYHVPAKLAADVTRYVQGFREPEAAKGLLGLADQMTAMTKAFQTAPFPGFHARNFVSGLWQNLVSGVTPGELGKSVADANSLLRTGAFAGAAELPLFRGMGLTDEQASRRLADMAKAHRAVSEGYHYGSDVAAAGVPVAKKVLENVPGEVPFPGFLATAKGAVPKSLAEANPFNVSGVVGHTQDVNSLVRAGRQVGTHVEDVNRLSGFIAKLRQGYDPATAAAEVRAAHVDYGDLTEFERKVMRRLVPFYTFTRKNLPYQLEQLATRPGGPTGQAIRLADAFRQQQGFLPPYLAGGLGVPVGTEEDGKQRYLTRLDLPHEQALELLKTGPRGLEDTAMSLAAQLNPLVKAPLEFATGKQFFTGREMADLYPGPTGVGLIDQLLANSPASRAISSVRTLADERKGVGAKALNLLTGLKVSDVDMEKQRAVEARDLVQQMLAGEPGVRRSVDVYAKPGEAQNLSTRDVELLRLNRSLERDAQEAKKRRVVVR